MGEDEGCPDSLFPRFQRLLKPFSVTMTMDGFSGSISFRFSAEYPHLVCSHFIALPFCLSDSFLQHSKHGQASPMEMQPFVTPPPPCCFSLLLCSVQPYFLEVLLLPSISLTSPLPTQLTSILLLSSCLIAKSSVALQSLACLELSEMLATPTQLSFHACFPTCSAPRCFLTMCILLVFVTCFFYGLLSGKSYLLPWL